jgi:hypothetical protein
MKIKDNSPVQVEDFQSNNPNHVNAGAFMTVWLLNIKRIVNRSKINPEDFNLLDVGCGKAISTMYFRSQYNFKSVSGFDFEQSLLDIAEKNILYSESKKDIDLFNADASTFILENKKWFLFMFNPFDSFIMENFMKNNIETLRNTNSVVGYANTHQLQVFKAFAPKKIIEIPNYKLAVIFF